MHARRQAILLTGFGPFPGVPTNASAVLVPRLAEAATQRLAGYAVVAAILPTEWRGAPMRVHELLSELKPTLALHFGVSSRTEGFAIEMRGRNHCSRTADACGEAPHAAKLADGSPDQLPATVPARHVVDRLRQRRLPAQVSRDAGGYICNALLYHSLDYARRYTPEMRVGFVHIPDTLVTQRGIGVRRIRQLSRLDLDGAVEGGLEILAASLGRPSLAANRAQYGQPELAI